MANWSQSHLLQSLGWATLNSFWQMALLWCIYLGLNACLRLSAARKYQLSVISIIGGFAWFLITFFYFFRSGTLSPISFINHTINESSDLLNMLLQAASIAYLSLLIFPSYRLFRNWQFVQRIRKEGLHKAQAGHRVFVSAVSARLHITKKVLVYLSDLVQSPMTIGYIKPVILLPLAAINQLTTQQVEAILLHELSHIKRYDYLVNFLISIINTLLYFNPFVRQFMKNVEEERENCCDALVLQFGYDKVSYASALLTLEQLSAKQQVLAMGAAGRNYLISRIEKIVGMERKKRFKRNQFAAILAALLCIAVFNSVLIIKEKTNGDYSLAYNELNTPFTSFDASEPVHSIAPVPLEQKNWTAQTPVQPATQPLRREMGPRTDLQMNDAPVTAEAETLQPTRVALDDVEASLTAEQKEKIQSTVAATKKIITSQQWAEINKNIADAMTDKEKAAARKQYLAKLETMINWKNVEGNLKAQYNQVDWDKINANVNNGLAAMQLDSIKKHYDDVMMQLDKANREAKAQAQVSVTPLPDQSIEQLNESRSELRKKVKVLDALRENKKVIRL